MADACYGVKIEEKGCDRNSEAYTLGGDLSKEFPRTSRPARAMCWATSAQQHGRVDTEYRSVSALLLQDLSTTRRHGCRRDQREHESATGHIGLVFRHPRPLVTLLQRVITLRAIRAAPGFSVDQR